MTTENILAVIAVFSLYVAGLVVVVLVRRVWESVDPATGGRPVLRRSVKAPVRSRLR